MSSRAWIFTLNNPENNSIAEFGDFAIWQLEKGANGTPHLQGYVYMSRVCRLSAMKKKLPTAHWEPRQGTHEQAYAYCSKEDTRVEGPWTYGVPPAQGARTDIAGLVDLARSGTSARAALEAIPAVYARYHRAYAHILDLTFKPVFKETRVLLMLGPTRCGKTRLALENAPDGDVYMAPVTNDLWFDGYDGQQTVLLDEYRGQYPRHLLLRLLDCYTSRIPIKGGFTTLSASHIVITSNATPKEWYDWSKLFESWDPLVARITDLMVWNATTKDFDYYEDEEKTKWLNNNNILK